MTPVRRIAAAALVGALGFGFVGIGAGPANAIDTTWGLKTKAGQTLDTTWGEKAKAPRTLDTTWGTRTKNFR